MKHRAYFMRGTEDFSENPNNIFLILFDYRLGSSISRNKRVKVKRIFQISKFSFDVFI